MTTITNLKFKDGDDDDEKQEWNSVKIDVVSNGWVITADDEEGNELAEVYPSDRPEALINAISIFLLGAEWKK